MWTIWTNSLTWPDLYVLPGRSCRHAPWEHYPSCWGGCTSPSCHRWSAWYLSSPGQTKVRKRSKNIIINHQSCQHNTRHNSSSSTSLVMQPSLLRSYRLKAQWSLSLMEPLKMMERLITKSYSRKKNTLSICGTVTKNAKKVHINNVPHVSLWI